MVWFQCEDCGENLKKPKLPNHFRICSAFKLSCIDCGEVFDRQSVQTHTQCITEAEKYGPKGQGKVENGTPAKPNKDKAQKPDVDINVGLSNQPPWFCSLCNTNATSKQTLLLHADGKKHRAKARAYAAAQQPKPSEDSAATDKDAAESTPKNESSDAKSAKENKESCPSNGVSENGNCAAQNGNLSALKKRKIDSSHDDGSSEKSANGVGNGNEIQGAPKKVKKFKHGQDSKDEDKKKPPHESGKNEGGQTGENKECSGEKIKWKKLITTTLKSAPGGVLKMKKLQKLLLKRFCKSGITVNDSELGATLEHKVNSSSKFSVDGKYVRLVV